MRHIVISYRRDGLTLPLRVPAHGVFRYNMNVPSLSAALLILTLQTAYMERPKNKSRIMLYTDPTKSPLFVFDTETPSWELKERGCERVVSGHYAYYCASFNDARDAVEWLAPHIFAE